MQVVRLEDEPDLVGGGVARDRAPAGPRSPARRARRCPADGALEAGDQAEQRRLSAAARPGDGEAAAGLDLERHAVDRADEPGRASRSASRAASTLMPGARRHSGVHGTVREAEPALRAGGELVAVGDVEDAQAALAPGLEDHAHDLLGGRAVELARDLVGEQEVGLVGERDRDGDALRLASRERVRAVMAAAARGRAPRAASRARPRRTPPPASSIASSTFSHAVRNGMRLSRWSTTPMRFARSRARSAVVERRHVAPVELDACRRRAAAGRRAPRSASTCRCPNAPRGSSSRRRRARGRPRAGRCVSVSPSRNVFETPSTRTMTGACAGWRSALRASGRRPARSRTQPASWCGHACRA